MKYTILILRKAIRDHAIIMDYLASRSRRGSEAWAKVFDRAIDRLKLYADNCSLTEESKFINFEVREILFKTRQGLPYRILFTINENEREVVVMHIRGPGQDYIDPEEMREPT